MRGTGSSLLVMLSAALLIFLIRHAQAAEIRSGDEIKIKADEVINDDLYCFGQNVTVDGTIEGDVVVFASQITINGTVKGHIMAAGQTVVITGEADGARIAGQVLKLGEKANLNGDLLGAGLSLECVQNSVIGGDALFAGYQALFAGRVAEDVRAALANCRLSGAVEGDVFLEVGNDKNAPPASTFGPPPPVAMPNVRGGLTLDERASIDGDLTYQSTLEANIDPDARVAGELKHKVPQPKQGNMAAPAATPLMAKVLSRLRHLVSVLLVGLVALWIMPRSVETWSDTIRQRPAMSLLSGVLGLLAFIALLVVAVVVIVAAAILLGVATLGELIPMVIVGGLVGYAALIVGFWIVVAYLAEVIAGLALGRLALQQSGLSAKLPGGLVVGVLMLALMLSVPYVGGIVGFLVVVWALGSICLWLVGQSPPQSFAVPPPAKPTPAFVA